MDKKIIAVVEDDVSLLENYTEALEKYGYSAIGFQSREEAEQAFSIQLPDLVIIDVELSNEPEGGFTLCQYLRSKSPTLPIIFLSARDHKIDITSGFRLGADDYIIKNTSIDLILVRITALFNRLEARFKNENALNQTSVIGRLTIDRPRMQASWDQKVINLTVTEFWLLLSLIKNPGEVKSKAILITEAHLGIDESTVTTGIKRIRDKFCMIDTAFDALKTKYAAGYYWQES
jgi:two-component system, OmpR family, response regulator